MSFLKDTDLLETLAEIYTLTRTIAGGQVASYIPQLAKADPQQYAVAVCLADGR